MRGDCRERLAIQMYTVHEHAWANLEETLQALANMGYRGIEYYGHHSMFDRNVTAQMEARTGMKMIGWHTEWADLQEDTYEETVSYLEAVGCPLIVVPCLGGDWNIGHSREQECRDVWLRHLDWLNQLYEKLSARGLGLAYHNHNHEFLLNYDGQKVFELLFNNLRPEIMMEFDTVRAICAGEDCCQTLRQYSFREALLHLKPYSNITGYESFLGRPDDCNNVREILRAYEGNFDWIKLESENRAVDEMENAKKNFEYLNLILGDV